MKVAAVLLLAFFLAWLLSSLVTTVLAHLAKGIVARRSDRQTKTKIFGRSAPPPGSAAEALRVLR